MFFSKVTNVGACCGTIFAAYSFSNNLMAKEMIDCHECRVKRLPKAKELPLYDKTEENFTVEYDQHSKMRLVSEISKIRVQLSEIMSYLNVIKKEAVHIYETGVAHSHSTYDYITSEENRIPRVLIITSGGLAGIIFARRGGYIKKAFYGSLGAGLVFSAFYPSIAKEYVSSGLEYSKQHTMNILEKYGGYDTKKIAEEANTKVEYVKNTLKIEGLTNSVNEWLDKKKEAVSKSLSSISEKKSKDGEPEKSSK